jgi:hypothetical protein
MSLVSRLYAHQKDTLLEDNYNKPSLTLGNDGYNVENLLRWIVTEPSPDADNLMEGYVPYIIEAIQFFLTLFFFLKCVIGKHEIFLRILRNSLIFSLDLNGGKGKF